MDVVACPPPPTLSTPAVALITLAGCDSPARPGLVVTVEDTMTSAAAPQLAPVPGVLVVMYVAIAVRRVLALGFGGEVVLPCDNSVPGCGLLPVDGLGDVRGHCR